jgi:phosphonate transport system permease protein
MDWGDVNLRRYSKHAKPVLVFALLVLFAAWECEVSLADLANGLRKGLTMINLFFPPDWQAFARMVQPALATVAVAALATPIGAVCAVVFGLAGASNIAPRWLRFTTRSLIALERGIPEIVLLLILVAAFGMGAFAGVIALVIGSIGMLGKLVADAIEEIDARTVDSVECVGATRAQVIRYAVLPQVFPSLVANTMFRFEVNIRASVLLGAVGAGGIGYELTVAINQLEYRKATVAAIVSLALVFLAERGSDILRSRMVAAERLQ